jgi:hypothetical protein
MSLDEIINATRSAEADAGEARDDDQDDRQAAQGQQGAEAQSISEDMAQEEMLLRARNNQHRDFLGRGRWGTL